MGSKHRENGTVPITGLGAVGMWLPALPWSGLTGLRIDVIEDLQEVGNQVNPPHFARNTVSSKKSIIVQPHRNGLMPSQKVLGFI